MSRLEYSCRWVNADNQPCERLSRSAAGYCRWHLLTHRLEQFWTFRTDDLLRGSWLRLFGVIILYIFLGSFFRSALEHTLWLYSGIYGEKSLNYNPTFTFVFYSISLILLGLITLTLRGLRVRPNLALYITTGVLWVVAFYLLNMFGLVLPQEDARVSWLGGTLLIVFIPVVIILAGLERRTGHTSLILILAGLAFISLAGLVGILLYLFDYLPWVAADLAPGIHQVWRNIEFYEGIGYLAVAIDAGLALFIVGNLVTPFPGKKSFYARPFRSRPDEGFLGSILRLEWSTLGLLSVLYGQAAILRHMLLIIFRAYPFDFLPWPYPYSRLIYVIIVVGIHFAASRRGRGAEALS